MVGKISPFSLHSYPSWLFSSKFPNPPVVFCSFSKSSTRLLHSPFFSVPCLCFFVGPLCVSLPLKRPPDVTLFFSFFRVMVYVLEAVRCMGFVSPPPLLCPSSQANLPPFRPFSLNHDLKALSHIGFFGLLSSSFCSSKHMCFFAPKFSIFFFAFPRFFDRYQICTLSCLFFGNLPTFLFFFPTICLP